MGIDFKPYEQVPKGLYGQYDITRKDIVCVIHVNFVHRKGVG